MANNWPYFTSLLLVYVPGTNEVRENESHPQKSRKIQGQAM